MTMLRETNYFIATQHKPGKVKIVAKGNVIPKQRIIKQATFDQMTGMNDSSFNGTCVLDLGIGCFQK